MLKLWGFILCLNSDISWQKYEDELARPHPNPSIPLMTGRRRAFFLAPFYPRWKDSDLIRFMANLTPWGHSFSSLDGGRQNTASQIVSKPLGTLLGLIGNLTAGEYWNWAVVFREKHFDWTRVYIAVVPYGLLQGQRLNHIKTLALYKMNHHIHILPSIGE